MAIATLLVAAHFYIKLGMPLPLDIITDLLSHGIDVQSLENQPIKEYFNEEIDV